MLHITQGWSGGGQKIAKQRHALFECTLGRYV